MSTFAAEYRKTDVLDDKKPFSSLNGYVHYFLGLKEKITPFTRTLRQRSEAIEEHSKTFFLCSDDELNVLLERSRVEIRRNHHKDNSLLVNEALALLAEASCRTLGMRPYAVQLMGVLAMYYQYAIEMATGEGKTLTAALSGVLAAWRGRPCHIVTSNDYLAGRDAQLMRPLYERCRVSVSAVLGDMEEVDRRLSYRCGVVYATSKELLADFLRDRMVLDYTEDPDQLLIKELSGKQLKREMVMQGLHTAIIDEADSVLIDDATTPLIISAPSENKMLKDATLAAVTIAKHLYVDKHYMIHRRYNDVKFTQEGESLLGQLTKGLHPIWQSPARREDLLRQALLAKELYCKDTHYVIIDEKIVIVDEKTGRLMHGRSWSYGLHQAIEAKEGVPLSDPTCTQARMSFQRFFRLYKKISGMSGTLQNLSRELWHVYELPLIRIPSRLPCQRNQLPDKLFINEEGKWQYVIDIIEEMQRCGRPVLVGTRSILDSEALAKQLGLMGIACNILNAVHHDQEAAVITKAGDFKQVTIATNMAGRGTDIILEKGVAELGGLHVIATERHESRRVDHQLFGRSARQGQPGSAQAVISLDDYIVIHLTTKKLRSILKRMAQNKLGNTIAGIVYVLMQGSSERSSSKQRKQMLQDDYKLNEMLSFAGK